MAIVVLGYELVSWQMEFELLSHVRKYKYASVNVATYNYSFTTVFISDQISGNMMLQAPRKTRVER